MNEKTINFSYDIPIKIKGSVRQNTLTRKEIVKHLIAEGALELDYEYTIYNNGQVIDVKNVIYPVKSSIVFASQKGISEIAQILSQYNDKLYYVLTEVKENIDDYLARMQQEYELQQNFDEEIEEIRGELFSK